MKGLQVPVGYSRWRLRLFVWTSSASVIWLLVLSSTLLHLSSATNREGLLSGIVSPNRRKLYGYGQKNVVVDSPAPGRRVPLPGGVRRDVPVPLITRPPVSGPDGLTDRTTTLRQPEKERTCRPVNRTVLVMKKNCQNISMTVSVCQGYCYTGVHLKRRFPYVASTCRSCHENPKTLTSVKAIQHCKLHKHGRRVRILIELPSARDCKCLPCIDAFTMQGLPTREKIPKAKGQA